MNTETTLKTALICTQCKTVISDMECEHCPECGSPELTGYDIENPYSSLPMQRVLRVCGHIIWLLGTVACLFMLWQTDNTDKTVDIWFMLGGFGILFFSIIVSVTLFAIAEILRRLIRIQRKLRAFVEEYYETH